MNKYLPYIIYTLAIVAFGFFMYVGIANAATSILQTFGGGTGTSSPSGLLYGDNGATTHLNTVTVGSGLTFSAGTLTASGSSFPFTPTTNYGVTANSTSTPIWFTAGLQASTTNNFLAGLTVDSGTTNTSLNISGHSTTVGSSLTISDVTTAGNQYTVLVNPSGTSNANANTIPLTATFSTGGGSTGGLVFDSKPAAAPIIFYAGGNSLTTNERLRITGAGLIGVASSTPTSLLSVGGNVFIGAATAGGTNGTVTISGLGAGFVQSNTAGLLSSAALTSGQVTTALGFTPGAGTVTSVNASGGTTGLTFSGGPVTNSGTLTLAGTLGVANGGTGSTTLSGILIGNGTGAVNTLTIGTGLSLTGTTLSATGSGSGTVGSGTTGQFPYYAANGTTLTATSSLFLAATGNVGVSTTSPWAQLSVGMASSTPSFVVGVAGSTTPALYVSSANNSGFVGIGTSIPDAPLTISMNPVFIPLGASNTGTVEHTIGPDGLADRFTFDSVGAATVYTSRRADGTAGTPTALGPDENIATFGAQGYTGSAYTATKAQFNQVAAQTWTPTANGTYMNFFTTANNTTTITERVRIDQSGNVGIGTTTPLSLLQIATSSVNTLLGGNAFGQLTLTDTGAGTNLKHWLFTSDSGALTIGTTSDKYATGTPALQIDKNGLFGIGTSTPGSILSVAGVANFTTATTTFYGNGINIPANQCYAVAGTCIGAGGVTSINASGGTTGLTFSGGPITTSGTLTLAGTLAIANGGTNTTSLNTNSVTYFDGTRLNSSTNFLWQPAPEWFTLGTTTSDTALATLATSTGPQLSLSDGSVTATPWFFRTINSSFFLSTSSPTSFATSTNSLFSIIPSTTANATTTFSLTDWVLNQTSPTAFVIKDAFGTIDAIFGTASTTGSIFTVAATTSPASLSNPVKLFDVDQYGGITASSTGATPTVACTPSGGSLSANSNDSSGTITAGTLSTACTVTFAHTKLSAPVVQASGSTVFAGVTAQSTTAFTVSMTATTGDTINYWVIQP